MSEHILYIVPKDPWWQPAVEDAERAAALLRTMAQEPHLISFEFFDRIEMFDPYENWEGVSCPACGTDLEDWFNSKLENIFVADDQISALSSETPCCQQSVSLNDLDFGWPFAFGRFALKGENAGAVPDADDIRALEHCIGSKLTAVWQHR